MKATNARDKKLLLLTAAAVARELKQHTAGTSLRVHLPRMLGETATDGWYATIGDIGKGRPHLQVWLDHFTRYTNRRFWFGFDTDNKAKLTQITKQVAKKLRPLRTLTWADAQAKPYMALITRLRRQEFSQHIFEEYEDEYLYGMYDPATYDGSSSVNQDLCARASAFFESVARALPKARAEETDREVYPQFENRKVVSIHLRRERSRLLATERKIRDKYTCQICYTRLEDFYGPDGNKVAEAHHKRALAQLNDNVLTTIDDLITVCPNCHRVLHKMSGKASDIATLRQRLRDRRTGRGR